MLLAWSVVGFCFATMGLAIWASRRVHSAEDFVVAGRRLPFWITSASLIATWFGVGPLMVAADEVHLQGLRITALEPLGAGLCLILAAALFARRLWNEQLLTLNEYYGRLFGRRAELWGALYTFGFIPWVATQFLSLGNIFHLFFDIPVPLAIVGVAVFLGLYTMLGGMWSVALTDFFQLALLSFGLVVLTWSLLGEIGEGSLLAGWNEVLTRNEGERLVLVPTESMDAFLGWVGLLLIGSIGNLAGQDLMQRIFSARTADIAVRACWTSGFVYILLGVMPVVLGLAAHIVLEPHIKESVIAALAERVLSPVAAVSFLLVIMAAVMSSVDSGLLAPAAVLATSVASPEFQERHSAIRLSRWAVAICTVAALLIALSGSSAFELLEVSYAVGLVPFVVLCFGMFRRNDPPQAGYRTLLFGLFVWGGEMFVAAFLPEVDLDSALGVPTAILGPTLAAAFYLACVAWYRRRGGAAR